MSLFFAILLTAACLVRVYDYWGRFLRSMSPNDRRSFWRWAAKGLGVPLLLWIFFNLGLFEALPPLALPRSAATGVRAWLGEFFRMTPAALVVISSFWLAASFGWILARIGEQATPKGDFKGLVVLCFVLLLPLAAGLVYIKGMYAFGFACAVLFFPSVYLTLPLVPEKKMSPVYSKAIAKMKLGKYNEAEWEVIRELERCEDDFDGWMMLGELYATRFKDLKVADQTIRDLCAQSNVTPIQISLAMHRLADWHLKIGDDPSAARSALEEICRRLPGTHWARMARLRLDQLPKTKEELREQRHGRKIRLPESGPILEWTSDLPEMSKEEAARQADRCVEKLRRDPNDVPARERLAQIFAERLGEVDLALEQLELLLGLPGPASERGADWLSWMAGWQLRYRDDKTAAEKLLHRIIEEYPQSSQAFTAQRRLHLMKMEARSARLSAGVQA